MTFDSLRMQMQGASSTDEERTQVRDEVEQHSNTADAPQGSKCVSYQEAGVNVELGDQFVDRIKALSKKYNRNKMLKGAGGYAAVYELTDKKYVALTTDGVGTKVLLAHQFNKHHGVGIDLVAMCANDLICVGAQPTLFLDYFATGKLDIELGTKLIEGILDGCDQANMMLVGGETAEMPDVYEGSHYDLAGFAIGEVTPETLITGDKIAPGQKIIGIASSGIHSNGLSLARKVLKDDADLKTLLTPTLIYVKPVMAALEKFPGSITGIAHITGGGLRNMFRLNPNVGYELTDPLAPSPIFEKILAAGVPLDEAYKTFNMGMGLALTVSGNEQEILSILNDGGFFAKVIGEVTDGPPRLNLRPQALCIEPEE